MRIGWRHTHTHTHTQTHAHTHTYVYVQVANVEAACDRYRLQEEEWQTKLNQSDGQARVILIMSEQVYVSLSLCVSMPQCLSVSVSQCLYALVSLCLCVSVSLCAHIRHLNQFFSCVPWYRVAKTHRIPYLHRSFPAKATYI